MKLHAALALLVLVACGKDTADGGAPGGHEAEQVKRDAVPVTIDAGPTPPPGMIWIPAGTLRAGTPVEIGRASWRGRL